LPAIRTHDAPPAETIEQQLRGIADNIRVASASGVIAGPEIIAGE